MLTVSSCTSGKKQPALSSGKKKALNYLSVQAEAITSENIRERKKDKKKEHKRKQKEQDKLNELNKPKGQRKHSGNFFFY